MWAAAIFGLIGVVVGVGVTGAIDLFMERRRESRALADETRRRYRESVVTCRLIANEIDTIGENFRLLAGLKRTLTRPIHEAPGYLPSVEWTQRGSQLAGIVTDFDTWSIITSIYHNAGGLRSRMLIDEPGVEIPSERIPTLTRDADAAAQIAVVLNAYAQEHVDALEATDGMPTSITPIAELARQAATEVAQAGSVEAAKRGEQG